ncbi:MAG: SLC13/DASS family transporter [Schwartzia succinivorans]|nr:SLC13 family permease [Schwartzia succinivorans]MBE6098179.1 SLC13/DASS family transporter [Schwartzia succinivorans]
MSPAIQTLIVLAIVALLFVTELIPLAVTSMGGAIACGLLGVIPIKTVFSGLSNSTVVLFAGMFVISSAMFHTGLAQIIGERVVRLVGTGENSLMFGVMAIGAIMSSVSSNSGTCAALMPVIMGICSAAKISPQRQMMPLAFGCGIGGIITLVGTPPNIIASGALQQAGLKPFGFFEFAWIGVPLTITAIVYMMLIGKRFLPSGEATNAEIDEEAAAEAQASSNDPKKQWLVGLTLIAVIIAMATSIVPLQVASVTGALFLVITKCITEQQAYRGIDWVTIFLFAGMMPVATAMDKSGAGKLIADAVVGVMGGSPSPLMVTGILFALSCGLTQFMSNTASAALLCPIGISIAQNIGADPHAVLMAIAVAASCAFATPVGTPPNTLVLGPGGYHFKDYIIAGTPLILVCLVVSLIVIPIVWPFFP